MPKPDSWYISFADWGMTAFGDKLHAINIDEALCSGSLIVGGANLEPTAPEDYCRRCVAAIRRLHREGEG
jgi:hypothetical protein